MNIAGGAEEGACGCDCESEQKQQLQVGAFHEIDHSNLPPNSPLQLLSVRIALVTEINEAENLVSLRYPSIHSLRNLMIVPALDEKCVLPFHFAVKALHRRVPTHEFAQRRSSWAFWASPQEQLNGTTPRPNESPPVAVTAAGAASSSKQGRCWSDLKYAGMVQWGKRRQVRFLGRYKAQLMLRPNLLEPAGPAGPSDAAVEAAAAGGAAHTVVNNNEKKRKKSGEEELVVATRKKKTRRCNRSGGSNSAAKKEVQNQQSENETEKKKKQNVAVNSNKKNKTKQQKAVIDRWSAERYKLAEENMLKVMKEKGAVYGNPITRAELRSEARNYIGDTGLLDHLLKHIAGKVALGGSERFRRRHNAEGAMEYWLESADLVDIRREAGVQDPYWTPPPGWTLGDSINISPHDQVLAIMQLKEIKTDILQLKQEMRELASTKGEEALATVSVATPTSCLSNLNLEDCSSLLPIQEMYAELVKKKAKIEEQLKEISLTLSTMAEQLGMSESATPPELLLPSSGDTLMRQNSTTKDKEARIVKLRSGFQICKPKGTFVWPNMDVSPQVVDDNVLPITPSSDSSSTASAPLHHTQHLPLPMPNPFSHVRPLAARRPLSTATLTHVIGPFSNHLSQPLEIP